MSKHLQRDLETLKKAIIMMGEEVEDRVYRATMSILRRDVGMAKDVIESDSEIDTMEVQFEENCLSLLALHQPVAIDLRFIVASLKINSELERVGDLAVNIAERSAFLGSQEGIKIPFDLSEMALTAEGMLSASIDALVNFDTKLAYRIRTEDDLVDRMNREMYEKVKAEIIRHPEHINCLLHALSVGRHLERIADHATNIAEDVIYLVDADIVRHTPEVFKE